VETRRQCLDSDHRARSRPKNNNDFAQELGISLGVDGQHLLDRKNLPAWAVALDAPKKIARTLERTGAIGERRGRLQLLQFHRPGAGLNTWGATGTSMRTVIIEAQASSFSAVSNAATSAATSTSQ
jgi:hypothetical protein